LFCSKGRGGSSEGYSAPTSPDLYNEQNVDSAFEMSPGGLSEVDTRQGWKKPGFFLTSPVGFFLHIYPEERVFRIFLVSRILLGASRL
jgi:hypothetical protein